MGTKDLRGNVPTFWRSYGQGRRQALMFHCSLAHSGAFAGMAQGLGDLLTMRAFDLPGHGQSADWDGQTPLQRLTVDMALDLLEGPTDLIGHSFGGTAALRLACERPDLVRSLTLIEPVYFAAAYADNAGLGDQHGAEMAEIADAIAAGDRETAARLFLRVWGDGRPWAALPEPMQTRMMAQIHLITAAHPEIGLDTPGLLASGAVEALEIPTLLIEGGASPHYVGKINAALNRRIKGSQRLVIDGAGHMVAMSHADEVARATRAFLESVEPAPAH